jgi:hypothetical protein
MKFLIEQTFATNKRESIVFYTCSYLSKVIDENHQLCREMMVKYSGSDGEGFPLRERVRLFQSAWQIVESASILHQMIERSKDLFQGIDGYDDLLFHFKVARYLRNKRQHLHDNTSNLVGARSHQPLHGIITWSHLVESDRSEVREYFQVVTIEPLIHELNFAFGKIFSSFKPTQNPDLLTIVAFDRSFHIFALMSALEVYCGSLLKKFQEDRQRTTEARDFAGTLTEAGRVPINAMILRKQAIG